MASNLVKLISSDNITIEVDVAVAKESGKLKMIIETTGIDKPIPLAHVSGDTLANVMAYCKYYVDSRKASEDKPATPEDEIKAWDADFVKVYRNTLRDLLLAAIDLKINNLLKLTAQTLFK